MPFLYNVLFTLFPALALLVLGIYVMGRMESHPRRLLPPGE